MKTNRRMRSRDDVGGNEPCGIERRRRLVEITTESEILKPKLFNIGRISLRKEIKP